MKFLLKISNNPLLPIILLAGVWFTTKDILMLTAAIMILMTLQVVIEKIVNGKVAKMLFISWCLLIPLGAITLLLRDPIFLQWKFSIIHWLLGGMLAFSQFLNGQSFLKTMLISVGPQLESVPEFAWRKVTYFMAIAFVAIGTINLYFIYFSDIETWVNFKLFGVTILNMAIMSVSLFYLFSHSSETDKT